MAITYKDANVLASLNREIQNLLRNKLTEKFPDTVFQIQSVASSYQTTELMPQGVQITIKTVIQALPRDKEKTP